MAEGNKPLFGFQSSSAGSSNTTPFGSAAAAGTQPKPLFGGGAGGASPFGAPPSTTQASGTTSLFGSSAAPSTAPSLFGSATPAAATPSSSSSLFGKPQTSSSTPTTSAPSLFGNNVATTGGFKFPGSNPAASSATATPSLFGSAAAANTSTPSTSSAPSLFGAASGAMPDKNSVFANGTKMPQTSSGGLFQNTNNPQSAAGTPQPKPLSALSFTPAGKPPASTGAAGTGLFGNPASTTTSGATTGASLFGAKPDENKTPSFSLGQNTGGKSLFGEVKSTTEKPASGLFGGAQATSQPGAAPSSTSNLFGNILQKKDDKPDSTAPSSSLFSTPASSAPAAPSLFGAATSGAPAAPSLFGAAPSNASSNAPSLFAAQSSSAPPSSTTATSGAAPSGGLFGSTQPATSTATASATPSTGLFGATNNNTTSTSTAPAATAAPSLGGLFGAAPSNTSATTNAPTTSAQPTAAATTSNAGASLFGASTGNPPAASASNPTAQQPSSRLASKSLDEIITTWSTSLATHQKSFANVAERVAKWDRQLVQNSSTIGGLYLRVFQAERDTAEVERQLSNVEAGQRELDARLSHYENEVDRLLNAAGLGDDSANGGVDNEREQTYNAAEDCQSRLTDMGQNLTAMIEEINLASNKLSTTKKANASEDPLAQIVRVLNSHLAQLQAIDKGSQALTLKVEQAQRDAGQLAGRNGASGGKEWIEGFGRSYLGRR